MAQLKALKIGATLRNFADDGVKLLQINSFCFVILARKIVNHVNTEEMIDSCVSREIFNIIN